MRAGTPPGRGQAPRADTEGEEKERPAHSPGSWEFAEALMPSRRLPQGGPGWYRRSLASPHPPSVLWEGEEPQKPSLPSSPLLPPPRGGPLQFVVTALHVRKKKFAECPTPKKKKKIRNRAKKTCEWAWRMGLLKLRRSRGSPSHSASLRERSRARPARPPAPWTSEQVGARRPRPRPPPPPGSREIRFQSFPLGVPSRGPAGEPGAAPVRGARARGGTAGRLREGPGGDAAFLESARRGAPAARRPGRRPPGARRGGVAGSRRREPRAKVGESASEAGAGLREGDAARGEKGARRGRGREGGRHGEPEAGPAAGEERPTPRAAPLSLPGPPGGEGGKEGGRE